MKKLFYLLFLFFLLMSCSEEKSFTLLISGNINGDYFAETSGNLIFGGFARISQYAEDLRKEEKVILIESGNFIGSNPLLEKYKLLNIAKYDLIFAQKQEEEFFSIDKSFRDSLNTDVILSNIDSTAGAVISEKIIDIYGKKISFLFFKEDENYEKEILKLKEKLEKTSKKNDFIFLGTNIRNHELKKFTHHFPAVDCFIFTSSKMYYTENEKINGQYYLYAPESNKEIKEFEFIIDEEKKELQLIKSEKVKLNINILPDERIEKYISETLITGEESIK